MDAPIPPHKLLPRLEEVFQAAERLPPFPDVIMKVMPLIKKMASIGEIEAVIRYDPVIAANILALSRSAHYARRKRVESLREAIFTLGNEQLLQVILAACARGYLKSHATGYDLREGEMWQHAVATALMVEKIASKFGRNDALTLYTAGLLHDIGKVILNRYIKDYFDRIMTLVRERQMSFLAAEREVLGIDHQELGARIARRWKFPAAVVTAIAYHHSPLEAKAHEESAALVYVANRMVTALGIGCGVDGFLQPNQDRVFTALKITARMVDQFLADLAIAMEETSQFLSQ